MTVKVTGWAWGHSLPPTSKLILMAIADSADDDGRCWPSVRLVAAKACVSTRTVQRVLAELESQGLLTVEPRYRCNGGQSSNTYLLRLEVAPENCRPPERAPTQGIDSLSPSPRPHDACGGDSCGTGRATPTSRVGAAMVSPQEPPYRTLTESPPLQQRADDSGSPSSVSSEGDLVITDLKWPASLSNDRKAVMTNSLMGISKAAAQKLLDEVAGNMERNTVKTTPERLLSALVRRFRCGKFAPDAGLAVRMRRERAVNQPPPVAKEPVRPASPETIRAELAKIDKILGLGRSRGVAEE